MTWIRPRTSWASNYARTLKAASSLNSNTSVTSFDDAIWKQLGWFPCQWPPHLHRLLLLLCYLMPWNTVKRSERYSMWRSRGPTSSLPWTACASTCTHPRRMIGPKLSAFSTTYEAPSTTASIVSPPSCYMPLATQIGLATWPIDGPPAATPSSLAGIWFLEARRSSRPSRDRVSKPNARPWPTPLPKSSGFSLSSPSWVSIPPPPLFGVTTSTRRNPMFHACTKHMKIDFHFVQECIATKSLHVHFISTKDQVADIFTKPLSKQRFTLLHSTLNVSDPPLSLRGHIKAYPSMATKPCTSASCIHTHIHAYIPPRIPGADDGGPQQPWPLHGQVLHPSVTCGRFTSFCYACLFIVTFKSMAFYGPVFNTINTWGIIAQTIKCESHSAHSLSRF